MKKLKLIPITLLGLCVLFWIGSILKCEILTWQHQKEFATLYKRTDMIDGVDYLKVMEYSDDSAQVYYVAKYTDGNLLTFTRQNGQWVYESWKTVWSSMGSASDFVWPYFYHSTEGIGIFIIVGIPTLFIAVFILSLGNKAKEKQS